MPYQNSAATTADVDNPTLEDCMSGLVALTPMGLGWVDPTDVSNLVVFLASDEACYITGSVMPVDQGTANRAGLA
jgi:(+)-trans-carveol dehydrogenase